MLRRYLEPTELIRTDGIVEATAREITQTAGTDMEKARALYEWIVENTFRDPKVRGCGLGDIQSMLETKNLGGKCADLNALFVGFARVAGHPRSRRLRHPGRRLGRLQEPGPERRHHEGPALPRRVLRSPATAGCRWTRPTCARSLSRRSRAACRSTIPRCVKARAKLFGAWEMNWLAYNYAHDRGAAGLGGAPRSPSSCTRRPRPARAASTAWTRTRSATRSNRARSRSSRARCVTDASEGPSRGVFLS